MDGENFRKLSTQITINLYYVTDPHCKQSQASRHDKFSDVAGKEYEKPLAYFIIAVLCSHYTNFSRTLYEFLKALLFLFFFFWLLCMCCTIF